MIPPSVAIEIENGGDFATLVYSWKFQLEGPSATDFVHVLYKPLDALGY